MNSRNAAVAAICFGTISLFGCMAEPGEPPSAAETRPADVLPADPEIEFTDQLFFLLEPGGLFDIFGAVTVAGVHDAHVENFIRRPGVGVGRLPPPWVGPRAVWVELVPESQGDRTAETGAEADVVAGYDDITETFTRPDGTKLSVRERAWRSVEWNLMSVASAPEPAVYTANVGSQKLFESPHERMKAMIGATAPKRPIDAFETAGLAKLRAGAEVVARSIGPQMRVLGAVRAREQCLSCHKVEVGTMLGAFTYTLQLQSEALPEADRLTDLAGLTAQEAGAVRLVESRGGKVVRAPGGPVIELRMTFARNRESQDDEDSTRLSLHDSALPVIEAFPKLQVLDVSNSRVSDAGLKIIAGMKNLKRLDLGGTAVTAEGEAGLRKELPACEIVRSEAP